MIDSPCSINLPVIGSKAISQILTFESKQAVATIILPFPAPVGWKSAL